MDVDVFSILDSVMDSKSTYEHPYEKGYKYFDRYINRFEDYELRVTGYNSYRYEDLQGNSLEKPKYDYYKSHKSQSYEYHKFETDIRNGVIKEFHYFTKTTVILSYGRIIRRSVDNAFRQASEWSLGVFGLIFPGIYLLSVFFISLRNAKEWVQKNSSIENN